MNTLVIFLRHGEPDESVTRRCYGHLDVALSSRALDYAQRVAEQLHWLALHAIYTSSSRRAIESITPLALALHLEPVVDSSLREIDFGLFEGLTYDEIERRDPARYASWMTSPTSVTFPQGESFSDLHTRALSTFNQILSQHRGQTVLVATHGGVIRTLLSHVLAGDAATAFRLDQSFWGVSVVEIIDSTPLLRVMNCDVMSLRALFDQRNYHQRRLGVST